MWDRIHFYRNRTLSDPKWSQVSPIYKYSMAMMSNGGVKDSSHATYWKGFMEYYRTMTRIGFDDDTILVWPTNDVLLQIYIINCAVIRPRRNVFDTIRNKLRGIDYVAQLANKQQTWSTNPALSTLVAYAKRRNQSKECDTLPITAPMLIQIVRYVLNKYVYGGLPMNAEQRAFAKRWLSFDAIHKAPVRLKWYMWAIGLLTLGVLGLRGADCLENKDPQYAGYGLYVSDVTCYWQKPVSKTLFTSANRRTNFTNLHHIRFRLRNSKVAVPGQLKWLRMGRTHRAIDPAINICHVQQIQRFELRRLYKPNAHEVYLFHAGDARNTLQDFKLLLKRVVRLMGFMDPERMRLHGTRKGFATTLLQRGMPLSLIAFAGLWRLQAAIYRYLVHSQRDLLQVAMVYLYGQPTSGGTIDMDTREFNLMAQLGTEPRALKKGFFYRTRALQNANL